jgi:hypothetical protein
MGCESIFGKYPTMSQSIAESNRFRTTQINMKRLRALDPEQCASFSGTRKLGSCRPLLPVEKLVVLEPSNPCTPVRQICLLTIAWYRYWTLTTTRSRCQSRCKGFLYIVIAVSSSLRAVSARKQRARSFYLPIDSPSFNSTCLHSYFYTRF